MSNTYFQFKQFVIHQNKCAMKVCTDACLFGAWFAQKRLHTKEILDIGSGTGLLMLMLAQKQEANFSGIEIDPNCFEQLAQNIESCKWSERIKIYNADVRNFPIKKQFDFIITNPPFYEKSLQAESHASNLARHSKELTLEELLIAIDALLSMGGKFGILLPYHRSEEFERMSESKNFHLVEKLLVKQSPRHNFFRSILYYSRIPQGQPSEKHLVIQKESGDYTSEFIELLKEYYLNLGA